MLTGMLCLIPMERNVYVGIFQKTNKPVWTNHLSIKKKKKKKKIINCTLITEYWFNFAASKIGVK